MKEKTNIRINSVKYFFNFIEMSQVNEIIAHTINSLLLFYKINNITEYISAEIL